MHRDAILTSGGSARSPVVSPRSKRPTAASPFMPPPPSLAKPPSAGDSLRDCPDCPEMIVIPAGSFDMGAAATPFDRPVHRVTLAQPFAMSRNEVTFEEWDKCVAAGGCRFKPDDR